VDAYTSDDYSENWDWDGLRDDFMTTFFQPLPVSQNEMPDMDVETLTERMKSSARSAYQRIRQAFGNEMMARLERFATLQTIDDKWKEHLYEMDQLREGIGLRAYGQKDPLLEYKQEAFQTFSDMMGLLDKDIMQFIFKAPFQVQQGPPSRQQDVSAAAQMATVHAEATGMGFAHSTGGDAQAPSPARAGKRQPVKVEHKVGRNDPCPCGSGKKYKKCHGLNN
jgi:preprotein translocase subunit SecA